MKSIIVLAAALAAPSAAQQAAPAGPAAPATVSAKAALPGIDRPRPAAQQEGVGRGAPVNGVLVLYGNERCPTNADGDEIVVCERRSAEEQFRVPKELRNFEVTPQNRSWAAKTEEVLQAGASGIDSCSAVGVGGQTGCYAQQVRAARAENRARAAAQRQVP